MSEPAFETSTALWKLCADPQGIMRNRRLEGDWTLGGAIHYVITQHPDVQWQFAAISDDVSIDHLDMRRLASTSIFRQRFQA